MLNKETSKAPYKKPSIKEYGSVSDLVGTTFGGAGAPDGMGMAYAS